MLSASLFKSQLELVSHRAWLGAFIPRSRGGFSRLGCPPRHVEIWRRHYGASTRLNASVTKLPAPKFRRRYEKAANLTSEKRLNQEASNVDLLRHAIHHNVEDVDIKAVNQLYDVALNAGNLVRSDCFALAQCVHEALRREEHKPKDQAKRENLEELVAFAERLVKGIRKGQLPPDYRGIMHLLSFFKESGAHDSGLRFWKWLEQQDESFVDPDVYGAAIELLAVKGVPLAQLEELFQRALQRFPGNFNAYHLSPQAIVLDRDQSVNIKAISMILLEAIIFARLLRGNSRDAYLGLDTALRLYPAQTPARLIHLFMLERPLSEAYTVFAIACRAGVLLSLNSVRTLLTSLRAVSGSHSVLTYVHKLRAMVSILYMYVGGGGSVRSNVANELLIAVSQVLRLEGVSSLESKPRKQVVDAVLKVVRKMLEVFARYGASPGVPAFNSIITNVAGFGHTKKVIGIALNDMYRLGLPPTSITWRSIITAAGMNADKDLLDQTWQDLVHAKAQVKLQPDLTDLHVLIKACKLCEMVDFAKEAVEMSKSALSEYELSRLKIHLENKSEADGAAKPKSNFGVTLDVPEVLIEIENLRADLHVIEERTKSGARVQDYSESALPMNITPQREEGTSLHDEMRELYDELTTERRRDHSPSSAVPDESTEANRTPPALSSTSIPLGTLRYENWKSINYLLALAERNDQTYDTAVDEAIAAGVAPPQRDRTLAAGVEEMVGSYGLSDVANKSMLEAKKCTATFSIVRNNILRLRGILQ